MSVSVIVVTYNRLNLLKKNLKYLLNQTYNIDNIYVFNNNSVDGTKKYLNEIKNPVIKVINSNKNIGGAGGFSHGLQIAYKHCSSDYFWLMDDDSLPLKNSLYELIDSANKLNNHFGFLCSNVRWYKDKSTSMMNIPHPSKDWSEKLQDGLVEVDMASFVSILIPRKIIKELGFPITDMFIWGDDIEYTTRITNYYKSYMSFNSIVLHESTSNRKGISYRKGHNNSNVEVETIFNVPMNRLFYYRCKYRNWLYTSRKYYNYPKTIQLLLKDLFVFIRIPFRSKDHRAKRLWYILCGIIGGFFFNPTIKTPK